MQKTLAILLALCCLIGLAGFAFNEGSFQAIERGKGLHDFTVSPAPAGSLDATLAAIGIPVLAIDLRKIPKASPVGT